MRGVLGARDPRGRLLWLAVLVAGLVVVGNVIAEKVGDARFEREMREAEDVLLGRTLGNADEAVNTLSRMIVMEVADPHTRRPKRAVLLLGTVVPALRAGLASPDGAVRAASADALTVGVPAADAVPDLAALVARPDPDERVQRTAPRALAAIGPAAEEAIVVGLRSSAPRLRAECAYAIRRLGRAAVVRRLGELVALLSDSDPRVRAAALGALREGGDGARPALPAIAPLFGDGDQAVRLAAVGAVRDIGVDAATARALVPVASADGAGDVRADAVRAMTTVDLDDAGLVALVRPTIEAAVRDPDDHVRAAARDALSRLGAR